MTFSSSFGRGSAYSPAVDLDAVAHMRTRVQRTVAAVLGHGVSHPDVEDCVQEVFARVLERTAPAENLEALVLGIARHVAIDRIRTRVRERVRERELQQASAETIPEGTPEARLDLRVLAEHVAALPESQRLALTLFHLEGKRYHEIAASMGVSMGTVATWISRARQELLQKMEAP